MPLPRAMPSASERSSELQKEPVRIGALKRCGNLATRTKKAGRPNRVRFTEKIFVKGIVDHGRSAVLPS